jgi:iron complex outermembrane receptor protein
MRVVATRSVRILFTDPGRQSRRNARTELPAIRFFAPCTLFTIIAGLFFMKKLFYSCALLCAALTAKAQEKSSEELLTLSLEQLMNIQVVSASKKAENLFDAPLSASVLTREEIRKAGATSLMEALRLVPGLIVREQTNGNYDIHLRGLDNVPPNSYSVYSANTTTLVMIDNRPV